MENPFFKSIEDHPDGSTFSLDQILEQLAYNDNGLVPVITQDADTRDVLMMAWMSKPSILKTLETGKMTYWSRSRNAFWVKGESSGHTQELVKMRFDCDGDALLCLVNQKGPACHTLRKNCFYLHVDNNTHHVEIISD